MQGERGVGWVEDHDALAIGDRIKQGKCPYLTRRRITPSGSALAGARPSFAPLLQGRDGMARLILGKAPPKQVL